MSLVLSHAVYPAIPDQSARELNQPEVVDVLLLVPHQDPAAFRQPRQGPLDYPAPRLVPLRLVAGLLLLADPPDVGDVSGGGRGPFAPRVIERRIQAQVLRLLGRGLGPVDDDRLDGPPQELLLHDVGRGGHDAQRAAGSVDHEVLLGPLLATVGGVLAHLFPPRTGPCPASRRPTAIPTGPRRARRTRRRARPRSARVPRPRPTAGTSRGRCSWARIARAAGPTGSRS